jgi:hypothetical protein
VGTGGGGGAGNSELLTFYYSRTVALNIPSLARSDATPINLEMKILRCYPRPTESGIL